MRRHAAAQLDARTAFVMHGAEGLLVWIGSKAHAEYAACARAWAAPTKRPAFARAALPHVPLCQRPRGARRRRGDGRDGAVGEVTTAVDRLVVEEAMDTS